MKSISRIFAALLIPCIIVSQMGEVRPGLSGKTVSDIQFIQQALAPAPWVAHLPSVFHRLVENLRTLARHKFHPTRGTLYIVDGPSAAGKSTSANGLLASIPNIKLQMKITTRPPGPNESNGREYTFVSQLEFQRRKEKGEFAHTMHYSGYEYAVPQKSLLKSLAKGEDLLLLWTALDNVDPLRDLGIEIVEIFIDGPLDIIEARLRSRGREADEEKIQTRLALNREQMKRKGEFHHVFVNLVISETIAELSELIMRVRAYRTCFDPLAKQLHNFRWPRIREIGAPFFRAVAWLIPLIGLWEQQSKSANLMVPEPSLHQMASPDDARSIPVLSWVPDCLDSAARQIRDLDMLILPVINFGRLDLYMPLLLNLLASHRFRELILLGEMPNKESLFSAYLGKLKRMGVQIRSVAENANGIEGVLPDGRHFIVEKGDRFDRLGRLETLDAWFNRRLAPYVDKFDNWIQEERIGRGIEASWYFGPFLRRIRNIVSSDRIKRFARHAARVGAQIAIMGSFGELQMMYESGVLVVEAGKFHFPSKVDAVGIRSNGQIELVRWNEALLARHSLAELFGFTSLSDLQSSPSAINLVPRAS